MLLTVPYLQSLGCCLIIPFAGVFAVILDSKANYSDTSKYKLSHSALVGFLTGIFLTFFYTLIEVIITLIFHSNNLVTEFSAFKETINQLPVNDLSKELLIAQVNEMINDIVNNGFSLKFTIYMLIGGIIIYPIFSIIGSLITAKFISSKRN